jgi:DNA-binding winged helix-turn-helix (wHTH) protein
MHGESAPLHPKCRGTEVGVQEVPTDGCRDCELCAFGQDVQETNRDQEKVFRFDDVEVRTRPIGVRRGDQMIGVEPKAHAVLLVLLSRAGEAVERETLLDTVWGHRHVTPSVLNRIVAQLRRALGDDASHPRYIQTLHGRGYRFMVQPERIGADGESRTERPASAQKSLHHDSHHRR